MTKPTLSKVELLALLDDLTQRLRRRHTVARIHVIGGACIALAYGEDRTTEDIDARIDTGHGALTDSIREIARERGLPSSWLNEQATTAIPRAPDQRAPTLYQSPHLTVTGASPHHLLAMKLEVSRDKDVDDIALLIDHMGITRCDEALAIHHEVFPDSERRGQARAVLHSIARSKPDLTPPSVPHDEQTWLEQLAANAFPRYTRTQTPQGLTLEVRDSPDSPPQTIKRGLTLQGLARLECAHRDWPEEATGTIKGFAAATLATSVRASARHHRHPGNDPAQTRSRESGETCEQIVLDPGLRST